LGTSPKSLHSNRGKTTRFPAEIRGTVGAHELLKRKAEEDPDAQFLLARMRYREGTPESRKEAVRLFWKASHQGHDMSQYTLGIMYEKGDTVERDLGQAKALLRQATDQGHLDAQVALAVLLYKGDRKSKGNKEIQEQDKKEAKQMLEEASESGHTEAQYYLATIYDAEKGGKKGQKDVTKILESAAQQGHRGAIVSLALKYLEGDGVEKDDKKAASLLQLAAKGEGKDKNCLKASHNLALLLLQGRGIEKDIEGAKRQLVRCGSEGHSDSFYALSNYLIEAEGSEEEAEHYLRKAASSGHKEAVYQLSLSLLSRGDLSSIDIPQLRCLTDAIDEEEDDASYPYLLGSVYLLKSLQSTAEEEPVEPKKELNALALFYLRKAASLAHPAALCRLGYLYKEGVAVEKDPIEAQRFLLQAASQGHAHAIFLLADLFRDAGNLKEAAELFLKASNLGHNEARFYLAGMCMAKFMTEGSKDARVLLEAKRLLLEAAHSGHEPSRALLERMHNSCRSDTE
jgi:TPR repeat protein